MLNESQKKAVAHDKGAALCLAAAGSGKTTVLQHRVKRLIDSKVDPSRICCITFSKKAAENMQNRLFKIGCANAQISTFHSLGFRMLRWAAQENMLPFGYKNNLEVLKFGKSIIQDIIKSGPRKNGRMGLDCEDTLELKEIIRTISMLKRNLITVEQSHEFLKEIYGGSDDDNSMASLYAQIYAEYEEEKINLNEIDFDDMIMLPVYLLQNNEKFRKFWKAQFDYVMVDECQDNNLIQTMMYDILVEDHRNLFIVGDDFQSIYSFMESSPEHSIYNFLTKYPGASVYMLEENYRCQEEIINIGNLLSDHMHNPYGKKLKATRPAGCAISIKLYDNPAHEAAMVVNEIMAQKNSTGCEWKDISVLYRLNRMSRNLEDALVRNSIPYVIYGSSGFYNRKEVKDMVDILRSSIDPDKYVYSLKNILNISSTNFPYTTRRLGKAFITTIDNFAKNNRVSFWKALTSCPNVTAFQRKGVEDLRKLLFAIQNKETLVEKVKCIRDNCYLRYLKNEYGISDDENDNRLEIIDELMSAVASYKNEHTFLAYVAKMQDLEKRTKDPDFDGVQCMTVHRSKGLEFKTVFVMGLNDGILPHIYSGTIADGQFIPIDVSEERRIAYVAFTRAIDNLFLSCTLVDYMDRPVAPSMFISEVQLAIERATTEESAEYEESEMVKEEIELEID